LSETPFVLVVALTLPRAKTEFFRDYERKAARIMARYGGRIEKVMETKEETVLTEIHWVVFPNEQGFASYQKDEELAALQSTRMECGVETKVWRGQDRPVYGPV
jgi:hypothetical protein